VKLREIVEQYRNAEELLKAATVTESLERVLRSKLDQASGLITAPVFEGITRQWLRNLADPRTRTQVAVGELMILRALTTVFAEHRGLLPEERLDVAAILQTFRHKLAGVGIESHNYPLFETAVDVALAWERLSDDKDVKAELVHEAIIAMSRSDEIWMKQEGLGALKRYFHLLFRSNLDRSEPRVVFLSEAFQRVVTIAGTMPEAVRLIANQATEAETRPLQERFAELLNRSS
jgi:hypothetical protein